MVVVVEQDVGRLDVAVHEAAPVRRVERAGDLAEQRQRARRANEAVALEQRLQIAALDVAHRQEELPVLLAGLVDRDDVRVVERGGEPRLVEEAAAEALVARPARGRSA